MTNLKSNQTNVTYKFTQLNIHLLVNIHYGTVNYISEKVNNECMNSKIK